MKNIEVIFLDRDGVINELVYFQDQGIIDSPINAEQFHLCTGVAQAINEFRRAGYKVVLISNQPGIAKGNLSEDNFNRIRGEMIMQLKKEGAVLDREYYCFHHPEAKLEKYRVDCECRKPKPGLILQAVREMNIDITKSWFIGDNLSDVKAGRSAACHTILLGKMKCEVCDLMDKECVKPDVIKPNILEAAQYILRRR